MGIAKVYPFTEFEVSCITRSRFTEGGLKLKNSAPGPWTRPFWGNFLVHDMGLARVYPYTKFEVSSFTRSKDMAHVPLNGWMREGVCPNSRVDLRRFYWTPTKSGINIVEWSVLYANVLDFRYVFALSNYGANCLRLGMKSGANFVFFGPPFVLGGTLKKSL